MLQGGGGGALMGAVQASPCTVEGPRDISRPRPQTSKGP